MDIVVAPQPSAWQAWRSLPRAVRKEVHRLARDGYGYPDPAVARTALAWGRAVRYSAGWLRAAVVISYTALLSVFVFQRLHPAILPVFVAPAIVGELVRRATRAEQANLRAVLLTDRSSWPDVGTGPITIHRGRRIRWYEVACVLPAAIFLLPDPRLGGPDAFDVVCFAVATAALAAAFVRVRPGGRTPLMVLSPDGLQLPHRRVTMPWSALAWADLIVRRNGAGTLALVWTLEPAAADDRARRRGAWARERWSMRDHRTIVIPVSWMVEDPEVALTASWRFAEASQ
jgi:hypothetical protein